RTARTYDMDRTPAPKQSLLNEPKKSSAPAPRQAVITNATASAPLRLTNGVYVTSPTKTEASEMRPVQNALEAQIALITHGISCGPLDGVIGSQTRAALRAYQRNAGLPLTGGLDPQTRRSLIIKPPVFTNYLITHDDVARLTPISPTWIGKSQQSRLDYENLLELVAEKTRSHQGLVRRLNPGIDWAKLGPGSVVTVVAIPVPVVTAQAASVRIRLAEKTLQAFDAGGKLIAHFPCSIARLVEKRPVGELRVVTVVHNPNYTFNPALFPESTEARQLTQKLILPPGPNNPVGTAWIGLDRPGYGIHGTPHPEQVGRTESHGCFRLANWDAEYLARLVRVGTPVFVE
ncbi:MAG: L,D-transpeptidase, partial [Verrucomicrobiae bacterium]|nr:L,D-transpeptidase [Verrucomicrobiae bacterium]